MKRKASETKAGTLAGAGSTAKTAGQVEMSGTGNMEKSGMDEEGADVEMQGRINPDQQGSAEVMDEEEEDLEEMELGIEPRRNRLQLYNPSSMLDWGQFEAKFFSQLYTQTAFFDGEGNRLDAGNRTNYYSGIGNFTLGFNSRLNFGVDFWIQSVFIDDETRSPFRLFSGNRGLANGRTALTAVGPKVKWQPIRSVNNFTIQSSFLLPTAKDPEGRDNGRPFLATQNHIWWTQIFYTNNFAPKFQFFGEIDFYWNIDRRFQLSESGFVAMPMTVFLSYFPTSKITLYVNSQFWPTLGENVVQSWWYQAGVGGKYQLTSNLDLEASVGKFLVGRGTAGPATTYNFGIRYVKF